MIPLPETVAWYTFLAVVLWGLHRITDWARSLNIFSTAIVFFGLRHGLTVPFDHHVNQWYAGIDVSQPAYFRFYTSLVIMWTCILIGAWVGRCFLGSSFIDPAKFRVQCANGLSGRGFNGFFTIVLLFSIALLVCYQVRIDETTVKLFTGNLSSAEYRAMRDAYGEKTHYSAGLPYRLASIVRFGLLPTFVGVLYFASRRDRYWRLVFYCVTGLGLLIGLISGQKGASIFLLVALAIAGYYGKGRMRIRLFSIQVLGGAVLGVLLISAFYRLQYPEQSFDWALHATTYRLTSESDRSLQLYFQIYPDICPFLKGHSSGIFNQMTGDPIPVDALPERFIPIYYLGPQYLNTWNAAFIGDAWADFGYVGVAVESLLVGWLLFFYARWFARVKKNALTLGTQVGLMMAATRLSEVALTANLLTFGLASSFVFYLLSRDKEITPIALNVSNNAHIANRA